MLTEKQIEDLFGSKPDKDGVHTITYSLTKKVRAHELTFDGARALTHEVLRVLADHLESIRFKLLLLETEHIAKASTKVEARKKAAPTRKKAKRK